MSNQITIKKKELFGVNYSVTNYDQASDFVIKAARDKKSIGVSALAVHGLVESIRNKDLFKKVQKINLIVPDGQPIKWALNHFYNTNLIDRVYGPELTLHILKKATSFVELKIS